MSHEHNGHCCGSRENAQAQISHVGQMCCQGVCAHPEHQFNQAQQLIQAQFERLQVEERSVTQLSSRDNKLKAKSKIKKSRENYKKQVGVNLLQLLLEKPMTMRVQA